eukprot:TRINITY_DN6045_c2_g1_i4.p1 TRINITY_DN6045_c2_g1~~TRINITY_DN6045_c2_g1_i4.p1  ORF type:complete len:998 (-),score=286.89 TRINITY_DN6045_c2_g1_i4:193-3045(-)
MGPNTLDFNSQGSSVVLTLNETTTQTLTGSLHLSISEQALCIGDKCMMWPKPKPKLELKVGGGDGWKFEELNVTGLSLSVNGKSVTTSDVQKLAGSSFELQAGDNVISFESQPTGVKITLNGSNSTVITEPLHLDISKQAVCIGERCMMWPKPTLKPATKSWTFDSVEASVPLKVNGKTLTAEELKAFAGQNFVLYAGEQTLEFKSTSDGGVELTLNDSTKKVIHEPLHLDISKQALCIGEACMMWPKKKLEVPQQSEEEFLKSVQSKLGSDYDRLQKILATKATKESTSHHITSSAAHVTHGSVKHCNTKEEFDNAITAAGDLPVVLDCSAVWCVPCKKISPKFDAMAKEFSGKLVFLGADINDNVWVKEHYKVEQLPSFLFLKKGVEQTRLIGDNETELREMIQKFSAGEKVSQVALLDVPVLPKRTHYDYIVIGGGSGGMASAKEAAKLGAHVALFDYVKASTQKTRWGLGGTCVNVGCVPKKLMHYAALCGEAVHDASVFGWDVKTGRHNWGALVDNVQAHVKKLNFYYEKGLKTANLKSFISGETTKYSDGTVTYYNALAKFDGPKSVSYTDDFGNSGTITGDKILISVGGRPFVPTHDECPGAYEYGITSDDLFSRKQVPGKTLCVGAGYIALECGGFLHNLGYPTTIAVRSVPLRTGGFDRQCVDKVVSLMQAQGLRFLMTTVPKKIEKNANGKYNVTLENVNTKQSTVEEYDTVLFATGRGADTAKLNVDAAGVKKTSTGLIPTNDADQTNVEHIFAIGDVAQGRPELTPVAVKAGEALARRLFGGSSQLMDYTGVPTTVFTPFEYGIVGLSEEDAIKKYGADNIVVYLAGFQTLEIGAAHRTTSPIDGSAPEDFPTNSLSKLVCLKSENERVVGFHFVGPNAGEITQGFALALKLKATKKDFDSVVGIHPTDAESFMSLQIQSSSGEVWESSGGCGGGKCG